MKAKNASSRFQKPFRRAKFRRFEKEKNSQLKKQRVKKEQKNVRRYDALKRKPRMKQRKCAV